MELREIFEIIRKRFNIIVLITLAAVSLSAVFSFIVLDDVYETYTTLMVSKASERGQTVDIQYSDIQLNQKLVKTYSTIVSSNKVVDRVISDLNIDKTPGEIKNKLNVTSIGDTEIIKISVEDKDKEFAAELANATANVFMDVVVETMKMDNVQVIDEAKVPERPVKPRPMLNIAISAVLGVMLGFGVIFLYEYLDNTMKTPEDIETHLGVPVLGTIPKIGG